MDGMGRAALLRSGGWGYGALLAAMSAWALYGCARAAMSGAGGPGRLIAVVLGAVAVTAALVAAGVPLSSGARPA